MIDELHLKISNLFTQDKLSESEVDHLTTLIRKYQERIGIKKTKYPLLNFFCDWTKHATIDGNPVGQDLIRLLNDVLFRISNLQDNNQVILEISKVLSITQLRAELSQFIHDYEFPDKIVKSVDQWGQFSINIINIIVDCPLVIPTKKQGTIKRSIKPGVVATQFLLTWVDSAVFTKTRTDEMALAMVITLTDTTRILLPYRIYENLYITYKKAK